MKMHSGTHVQAARRANGTRRLGIRDYDRFNLIFNVHQTWLGLVVTLIEVEVLIRGAIRSRFFLARLLLGFCFLFRLKWYSLVYLL